jgi:hypothetical protein
MVVPQYRIHLGDQKSFRDSLKAFRDKWLVTKETLDLEKINAYLEELDLPMNFNNELRCVLLEKSEWFSGYSEWRNGNKFYWEVAEIVSQMNSPREKELWDLLKERFGENRVVEFYNDIKIWRSLIIQKGLL